MASDGPSSQRWTVIGGGMLGLTLAHRFAQQGKRVTLIEAAPELGGLASAWQLGDIVWDRHYHVTLLSDSFTRGIVKEVGLENEMDWVETKTGFYANGQLCSMSNAIEYLRLPALGLIDKLRIAATIVYGSRIHDWRKLEAIPVERWLTRLSGKRAFQKLWLPLLRAKLGESYRETSAAFIWATIARLYAARRTGLKKEMFGYVRGGYARLLSHFEKKLREEGVEIKLSSPVRRLHRTNGAITVELQSGEEMRTDIATVTAAAPLATRICEGLTEDERSRLSGVRYQGIVCASLLLSRPLADYYLTYLTDDWVPFTAVVEMSAMVDRAQLGGHSLVYLPKYAAPDDPIFSVPDEQLQETFLSALERIYPRFQRSDVLSFKVSRVKNVFPIPTLGYSDRVAPIRMNVPGLHIVNSGHIVNGTLNVNETVQLAEDAAKRILAAPGI